MLPPAMKGVGAVTTRELTAAMPAAAVGTRLGWQGRQRPFGRNPIDRHRARSLLCGSNWNSHDSPGSQQGAWRRQAPFLFPEIRDPHIENRIGMASQNDAWWNARRLGHKRAQRAVTL
jgi:hypothetical protein